MQLYDYQLDLVSDTVRSILNLEVPLIVLPTGGGKTVVMTEVAIRLGVACVFIAHRITILTQISLTLARKNVPHSLIGSVDFVRYVTAQHVKQLGKCYIDIDADITVGSIDTMHARLKKNPDIYNKYQCWILDEAHHLTSNNKWGKVLNKMTNCIYGFGVTATPDRTDGVGLGCSNIGGGGLFTKMIIGPDLNQLIIDGYLVDYDLYAPNAVIDISSINLTASGELNRDQAADAVESSGVTGDVVKSYLELANGKKGITFASSIKHGNELVTNYKNSNIPAILLSGNTNASQWADALDKFKSGNYLQLVSVDVLGEGVDIPEVSVVSFVRLTNSMLVHRQQFGRVLRLCEGKTRAIVIDHVGNTLRLGRPDDVIEWSLESSDKKTKRSLSPKTQIRSCDECLRCYLKILTTCPHCGREWIPTIRSDPKQIDGDLTLLDPTILLKIRMNVLSVDEDFKPKPYLSPYINASLKKKFEIKQQSQIRLRELIIFWCLIQQNLGLQYRSIYKLFYLTFSIDIMSAQSLKTKPCIKLSHEITEELDEKRKRESGKN